MALALSHLDSINEDFVSLYCNKNGLARLSFDLSTGGGDAVYRIRNYSTNNSN